MPLASDAANVAEESIEVNDFNVTMPEVGDRKGIWEKIKEFFSHEPQWYYKYYKFELCCLMVILILLITFFYGKD